MIYINDETTVIKIPAHDNHAPKANKLRLVNNLSNNEYSYDIDNNVSQTEYFYNLSISITNIPVGEYTYYLLSDNKTLETGLLTYGDYQKAPNKTYVSEKINAIIYERN